MSNPSAPAAASPDSGDHPLDLAVHSLPEVKALGEAASQRGGRGKMFVILLLCAAPVIASYFTYYVIRPEARRNFGDLIEPQRPLPDQWATTLDGTRLNLRSLKGQWLLTSVAAGQCDAACQQRLYLQHQLREGLGKGKDRVDWVWIIQDGADPPAAIRLALETATVIRLSPVQLAQWLEPAAATGVQEHLYLIDPLGNLMLRFPAGLDVATAGKAKRDLERLLRASAFWDFAGR